MDRWHERFDSVCLSEDGGGGVRGRKLRENMFRGAVSM